MPSAVSNDTNSPAVASIHVTDITNATHVSTPCITRLYLTCGHATYIAHAPITPHTAP